MINALINLYQHHLLSSNDLEILCESHTPVHFKKGEFILKKGQIANAYYCIEHGMIRSYVYDFEGHDITTGFMGQNDIAINVVSLFTRVPSVEYFQALTDCDAYMIDYDTFQVLYHAMKGFNEWGRSWMSKNLFEIKQRSISMITDSASERYLMLETQHPQILQQAPLKFIASYLGITDSSLSRIRKELVRA